MLYKLVSTTSDQTFELRNGGVLVVGRALNSDIPVFDPTISRRHAEVSLDGNGVQVRDLGSSNGTFVNGAKIDSARVSAGDLVMFGKVPFRLRQVSPNTDSSVAIPTPAAPAPRTAGGTIVSKVPVPARPGTNVLRVGELNLPDADKAGMSLEFAKVQQRLERLLEVSLELTRAVTVEALLETVVTKCFETFDVDRVAILLGDDAERLVAKVARDKRGRTLGDPVPQSIARTAFRDRSGIISDNASEDQRFGGQSILMQQVRSAVCAPLVGSEGRPLGVLYVDNQMTTHRFDEDDLQFVIAFSGIAAVAIENSQFAERIRRETLVRSNFERYFAPQLAARIAGSPDAVRLGGEKRQVTVLFSDIRGFTALSETMMPDDMASLLTEYFTEMVGCVFRHGGTLDKFIGDAVMAQWGAPIPEPDDADRAMRAALEMMAELDKLNAKWRDAGRPELHIGIGLNCGEAFAGNIGSEQRLEFTVIGDVVNTASRLCKAAQGGEILVSEELRRALKSAPSLVEREPMELKGKGQPVPVFSVEP